MKSTTYKTEWDLTQFYKSAKDPRIEADQKKADATIAAFAAKYRKNKKHLSSAGALATALRDYESLMQGRATHAPFYAHYRKDLDVRDTEATALAAKLEERGVRRMNQVLFFTLELGKIPKKQQTLFLRAPALAEYRYWLSQVFENARYTLSEAEEKILMLKSDVSFGRWVEATENVLHKKTVSFKGKPLPLPEAQGLMPQVTRAERGRLHKALNTAYAETADIAESEINAIYTDKKIEDELRGMKKPFEATIRSYQNNVESVLALVKAVSEHVSIAHRFYKVKRTLLGGTQLTYADRNARVGTVQTKLPFVKAAALVRDEFAALDPRYAEIFDNLLLRGSVDIYPKKGKTGGAYCSSSVGVPTMVLLNHTDNFESLKTLAHEMGHAIHAERAKTQRPLYQGHPISTAETASTFFEAVALNRLIRDLPEKDRIVALHDKIQDDINTVFRQVACFEFEKSLHNAVRTEGYVPKERIAALMNEAMHHYLGDAVTLTPEDGNFFVAWSHVRRFFYVYAYAYGQLVSKALHVELARDSAFIKKVDGFLCAGESASPEAIFKTCGLDALKPALFLQGLSAIEADVSALERLTK